MADSQQVAAAPHHRSPRWSLALVAVLLLACAVPVAWLLLPRPAPEEYFRGHQREYQAAADEAVEVASLDTSQSETWVDLSPEFERLSEDGRVMVTQLPAREFEVRFWRVRGLLGQWNGYVYVTDSSFLEQSIDYDEHQVLDENWGWALEY